MDTNEHEWGLFKAVAAWREKRRLAKLAQAFNRYSIKRRGDTFYVGQQWMCPHCGLVTTGADWSVWSGYQFKRCCPQTFDGYRSFIS